MKTRFSIIVGLAAGLLVGVTATVQAQFNYEIHDGTVTITKYTGPGGDVVIPDTIEGKPVVSIGDDFIGWGGNTSLTSVMIPDSVTSIGGYAFCDCTGLIRVTIGNGVTVIGAAAFAGCTSLTSIDVGALNPAYSSVAGVVFNKSQELLTHYPGGKAGSYTIPDSVTSIGEWAFWGCAGLTSVVIPDSVTSIGGGAFYSCTSLTSVTIGNGVTSIGGGAFSGCTSLTSVTIGNASVILGQEVFLGCDRLPYARIGSGAMLLQRGSCDGAVTIQPTIEGLPITHLRDGLFSDCGGLISVVIPDSVTSIGGWAFSGCTGLTSITIPDSVISIGERAFSGCTSLTNVISIGDWAFERCTGLTAIQVDPANPAYSGLNGVLFNKNQNTLILCPGGKTGAYAIPDSVTSIGGWAFSGCTSLTSIAIPDGVTSIGDYDFSGCTGLTSVVIPDSVTSIGGWAFSGCIGLSSVTIPDSVTSIGGGAFGGCSGLRSAVIPDSVTSIGWAAFSGCTSLTSVYFQGRPPSLEEDVFTEANKVRVYYLPGTTGWGSTFGGRPTAIWKPQVLAGDGSFGIRDGHLTFDIFWARDKVVVVEACADLTNPDWVQVGTRTLTENVTPFSDPEAASQAGHFYRIREQ